MRIVSLESDLYKLRPLQLTIRCIGVYILMPLMMFPVGGLSAIFLFWTWSGWLGLCGGPASFCDMISLAGLFIPGGIGLSLFMLFYNIRERAHRQTERTDATLSHAAQSPSTYNRETAQSAQPSATPNQPQQPAEPQHKGIVDPSSFRQRGTTQRTTIQTDQRFFKSERSYKNPVRRPSRQDFVCRRCGYTYHRHAKQKFCPQCGF